MTSKKLKIILEFILARMGKLEIEEAGDQTR